MRTDHAVTIYRHQYVPIPYAIPTISLEFDLAPDRTRVQNTFVVERYTQHATDLALNGIKSSLLSMACVG